MVTLNDNQIKIKSKNEKIKNDINHYIDEEINVFSYDLALKYDRRSIFEYFKKVSNIKSFLIECILYIRFF